MEELTLEIKYHSFNSLDELSMEDCSLAEEAMEAQRNSYAPYSGYNVGAAVRLASGRVVSGANQENNASPAGLCAERTAMFYAHAHWPDDPMEAIAIAGGPSQTIDEAPATPCGSCRQVMAEFQRTGGRPLAVILIGRGRILKFDKVDDLLPFIFTGYKPKGE